MQPTVGIGLKPEFSVEALASPADGLWFEVHAENYMVPGGSRLALLSALRDARPLSLHGVGLSLAGAVDPDRAHLARLRRLVERFDPFLVSEHLAWSRMGERCFPDLLPFPRTKEALDRVCLNVDIVQEELGRAIAVENPALYLHLDGHECDEPEFLRELVRRTGCTLLVDVNNVHVSANNIGVDAQHYLDALPGSAIVEIHLAGHSSDPALGPKLLIDSHDAPIAEPVWALYNYLISRIGPRPTLIERDGNVPPFAALMGERERALQIMQHGTEPVHA